MGLVCIFDFVVALNKGLLPILIQKSQIELPWYSICAVFFLIVNLIFTRLRHLDFFWVKNTCFVLFCIPPAKFRAWAPHTDLILLFETSWLSQYPVILWIKHSKLEFELLPRVDKLHMLDHVILFLSFGLRQNLKVSDSVKPFLKI